MSYPVHIAESDRQIILLALAELSLSRPGMEAACREIATDWHREHEFDDFRWANKDRIKPIPLFSKEEG